MLVDLEWLPPAPREFRNRLRALQGELAGDIQPNFYERLVSLAATSLSEAELTRLAGLSRWIKDSKSRVDELSAVRLGIMGDGTLSLLGPPIVGSGFRHGLLTDVIEGHYNSAVQRRRIAAAACMRRDWISPSLQATRGLLDWTAPRLLRGRLRQRSTQRCRACR